MRFARKILKDRCKAFFDVEEKSSNACKIFVSNAGIFCDKNIDKTDKKDLKFITAIL